MTYELPYSGEKYDIGSYDQDCCIYSKAEGSIASFTDGADDYPMKSVVAQIVPKQEGSGDPSPTNVRPISGWSGVNVNATGVNIWDEEWLNGDVSSGTGNVITGNKIIPKNLIPITPNTTYCYVNGTGTACSAYYYGNDESYLGDSYIVGQWPSGSTKTTPANAYYMRFVVWQAYDTTYKNDICINYPSTDHDYYPYQGSSYSIPFKDSEDNPITVYGGEIDVVKGEGKETLRKFVLDGTIADADFGLTVGSTFTQISYVPFISVGIKGATFLSNIFAFVSNQSESGEGKIWGSGSAPRMFLGLPATVTTKAEARQWFADNPTEVVYPLATPTDFNTTPTEIKTLKGNNNIWSDTGDISVEYLAQLEKDTLPYSGQKYNVGNFEPIEGEESPHEIPHYVGVYEPIKEKSREGIEYIIL